MKDLVIFLPGISGSTLIRDGRTLWGLSPSALFGALFSGSLDDLAIKAESAEEDLNDGITVGDLVRDVHLVPGLWKIDGYHGFIEALGRKLYIKPGRNVRTFPYDWRRDNRVSAGRLKRVALTALREWRESSGASDAKLILVAHSMGGLVARYFMEVLGGWRDTRQLITLGTPFRGSLNAAGFLVNGFARGIGPLRIDATATLRSFASVHQLLPTYACVDRGDGELVRVADATLPGIDPEKVADASAFHQEIEDAVSANASDPDYRPSRISPVLSSMQSTFQSLLLRDGKATLLGTREGVDEGGDGTVPMVSALAQGMQTHQGFFVEGVHASLQTMEPVTEFVGGQLRGAQVDLDKLRKATAASGVVRFVLEDAYLAGPIPLRAEVRNAVEQRLNATATEVETGVQVTTTLWPKQGIFEGELPLAPGTWRVTASGQRSKPATDVTLAMASEAAA